MKNTSFLILFLAASISALAQETSPLYSNTEANGNIKTAAANQASLTSYFPNAIKANSIAVLVIPGGGYGFLATETEGTPIAKAFAEQGIAAFVLKYRLPYQIVGQDKSIAPLQDAQQAIKIIRENAVKWNIDPKKVGVIGFSAGGHLASMLETKFGQSYIQNEQKTNLRPDFAILVYPVITMEKSLTHMGSRISLIGENANEELANKFSSETQVTAQTPPTYIIHTADDSIVDWHNSLLMYEALVKSKVPAELHLYPKGDHGFIQQLPVPEWLDPILLFLKKEGFYK